MEMHEVMNAVQDGLDRMSAAAAMLEKTAGWMQQQMEAQAGEVQRVTATAEAGRELELERKLEAAERQIAELRAQAGERSAHARKTVPAATAQLLAKQGISTLESVEAGTLDAALSGLSLEQRIAVKAQLLRAGVIS
jgi:histidinol phosphatase-like enzyme